MSAGTCFHQKAPCRGQVSVAHSEPEPEWRGNTPVWPEPSTMRLKHQVWLKISSSLYFINNRALPLWWCTVGYLSIISECPLEQSLLDHASPHFRLQYPLCAAPALVSICGMEDEKYQQIYHLEQQHSFQWPSHSLAYSWCIEVAWVSPYGLPLHPQTQSPNKRY